jgi:hypothetical protein
LTPYRIERNGDRSCKRGYQRFALFQVAIKRPYARLSLTSAHDLGASLHACTCGTKVNRDTVTPFTPKRLIAKPRCNLIAKRLFIRTPRHRFVRHRKHKRRSLRRRCIGLRSRHGRHQHACEQETRVESKQRHGASTIRELRVWEWAGYFTLQPG